VSKPVLSREPAVGDLVEHKSGKRGWVGSVARTFSKHGITLTYRVTIQGDARRHPDKADWEHVDITAVIEQGSCK
jgi:hypothetical protein